MNLAVNARDAMPDGGRPHDRGTASTSTRRDVPRPTELAPARYVLLAVSDTGTAWTGTRRRSIFEPFFTTKAGRQGHRASASRRSTASSSRAAATSGWRASRAGDDLPCLPAARRGRRPRPGRTERAGAGARAPRRSSSSRTRTWCAPSSGSSSRRAATTSSRRRTQSGLSSSRALTVARSTCC